MYGIPNMKLEKNIITRKIGLMQKEGITFKTNEAITTKNKPMIF